MQDSEKVLPPFTARSGSRVLSYLWCVTAAPPVLGFGGGRGRVLSGGRWDITSLVRREMTCRKDYEIKILDFSGDTHTKLNK